MRCSSAPWSGSWERLWFDAPFFLDLGCNMAAEWFVRVMGETIGPLGPNELQAMAKSGQLSATDDVRHGNEQWRPASEIHGLQFGGATPTLVMHQSMAGGMRALGGASAAMLQDKERRQRPVLWGAVLAMIGVLIAFGMSIETDVGNDRAAINAAHDAVLRILKAPSTASFPGEPIVKKGDGGEWYVYGDVEAKNSFGVMLRSRWSATARKTNGEWTADATIIER